LTLQINDEEEQAERGLQRLPNLLRANQSLTNLELGLDIFMDNPDAICQELKQHKSITEFTLNEVRPDGTPGFRPVRSALPILTGALADNQVLCSLNLCRCGIADTDIS